MAGMLLGLVSGGALGVAAGKYREHEQQKQQLDQIELKSLIDPLDPNHPHYDPSVLKNPEYQKLLQKKFGKEAGDRLIQEGLINAGGYMRDQQQKQEQFANLVSMVSGGKITPQQAKQMFGAQQPGQAGGGAQGPQGGPSGTPPMTQVAGPGGAPTAPAASLTAQPAQPMARPAQASTNPIGTPQQTTDDADPDQLIAMKAGLGMLNLDKDTEKAWTGAIDDKLKELAEKRKPATAGAEARARAQGTIDVNTDPGNVSKIAGARAREAGAASGASARAKLAPDIVAGEAAAAGARSTAETKAKQAATVTAPEKPETTMKVRGDALTQAGKEVPPADVPHYWTGAGTRTAANAARTSAVKARARAILMAQHRNPDTGQLLQRGDVFIGLDGQPHKWNPDK